MMTDPIADMLTRIRNAHTARLATAEIPVSKMKLRIADILKEEGYIDDIAFDGGRDFTVKLKYVDDEPIIRKMQRESTPGCRVYVKSDEIPRVLGGLGLAIVSTSNGVMAGRDARKQKVGGELLCTVY